MSSTVTARTPCLFPSPATISAAPSRRLPTPSLASPTSSSPRTPRSRVRGGRREDAGHLSLGVPLHSSRYPRCGADAGHHAGREPWGPVRPSPSRDAVVAILNGAFGDTLEAEGNPLAFPTTLRYQGEPFEPEDAASVLEGASDTMLLMVHGLCMHDGRWGDADHDMTAELARGLGATAIGVRYNSGRHVSQNGHDLADLLERLTASWPGLRRIVFVTHSMGGLVARSALEVARVAGQTWPDHEVDLVMLGTPHHGAPLERLGNVVDGLLGSNRFFKPYARLGKARSAGVTDLRFGSVHDDDWADRDRFERGPDDRHHVPLPDGVRSYIVAASPSGTQGLRDRTLGDGLVLLDSALGQHLDPERTLVVPQDQQWIAEGINHFDLVRNPAVTARVLEWLAPSRSSN